MKWNSMNWIESNRIELNRIKFYSLNRIQGIKGKVDEGEELEEEDALIT